MVDTPDEDAEWERWMMLTDAQQQAEVDQAAKEHGEWWQTLTWQQQYLVRRGSLVRICYGWRQNIKKIGFDMPIFRAHLKKCQSMLADLRAQRRGQLPGGEC